MMQTLIDNGFMVVPTDKTIVCGKTFSVPHHVGNDFHPKAIYVCTVTIAYEFFHDGRPIRRVVSRNVRMYSEVASQEFTNFAVADKSVRYCYWFPTH